MIKFISYIVLFYLIGIYFVYFIGSLKSLFTLSDRIINQDKYSEAIVYVDSLKSYFGHHAPSYIRYYGKVNHKTKVLYVGDISGKEMRRDSTVPIWYTEDKFFRNHSMIYRLSSEKSFEDKVSVYKWRLKMYILSLILPPLIFYLFYYLLQNFSIKET